jgi:hypothetical protein
MTEVKHRDKYEIWMVLMIPLNTVLLIISRVSFEIRARKHGRIARMPRISRKMINVTAAKM